MRVAGNRRRRCPSACPASVSYQVGVEELARPSVAAVCEKSTEPIADVNGIDGLQTELDQVESASSGLFRPYEGVRPIGWCCKRALRRVGRLRIGADDHSFGGGFPGWAAAGLQVLRCVQGRHSVGTRVHAHRVQQQQHRGRAARRRTAVHLSVALPASGRGSSTPKGRPRRDPCVPRRSRPPTSVAPTHRRSHPPRLPDQH